MNVKEFEWPVPSGHSLVSATTHDVRNQNDYKKILRPTFIKILYAKSPSNLPKFPASCKRHHFWQIFKEILVLKEKNISKINLNLKKLTSNYFAVIIPEAFIAIGNVNKQLAVYSI